MTEAETQTSVRLSFREYLTTLTREDFTPVAKLENVVNGAYFESRHWMRLLFDEAHDPDSGKMATRHWYHVWRGPNAGFDLLRHQYELNSRVVTVVESAGLIHISVRLPENDEARRLNAEARAAKIANWLLQLPADMRFVPVREQGWLVSDGATAAHASEPVRDWSERLYAISHEAVVEIVIYKEEKSVGPTPRNFSVWFDMEFRKNPPKA